MLTLVLPSLRNWRAAPCRALRVRSLRRSTRVATSAALVIRHSVSTIGGFNAAPIVGVSGSSVVEPGTGSVAAPVRVALSAPSSRTVSVRLHTVAGTADSSDFAPVDTTVTFPPGATSRAIDVPVLADAVDEPAEVFELQVVALTHAQVGAGTATIAILPPAV